MDLGALSLAELVASVRSGERSPVEIVDAALARIEAVDVVVRAFVALDVDGARRQAHALAERIAAGDDPGPLAGVPVGVKDLEDAAGFVTTHGDPARAADPPASRDSVQVARLRAAGAVVIGKTNTPAYGFRAETENRLFGATGNPWAPARSCGGSSGGSAAAVAAAMVPLATGSDGGGSIRIPSAACGLAGFKPTHNVVPSGDDHAPTWGPYSTRGPIARTFADVAMALDVVKGVSARDLMSVEVTGSFTEAVRRASVAGLRVAWSPTLGYAPLTEPVRAACEQAVQVLGRLGARVELVEEVFDGHPVTAWMPRAAYGAFERVREVDGPWEDRFDELTRLFPSLGEHITAKQLVDGEAEAHAAALRLAGLWERFDLLATPGMCTVPPRVGEPSELGPSWAADFTLPFNLVRAPAAVVPVGFVTAEGDEMPVALQLVGPRLADLRVIAAAAALEGSLGVGGRRPPI